MTLSVTLWSKRSNKILETQVVAVSKHIEHKRAILITYQ